MRKHIGSCSKKRDLNPDAFDELQKAKEEIKKQKKELEKERKSVAILREATAFLSIYSLTITKAKRLLFSLKLGDLNIWKRGCFR